MAYTGAGIYAPNEGPVDVGRIVELVKSPVGDGAVVLLAHQAGKDQALERMREAMPEAVIQIRRYVEDWTAETPRESAARFVEAMERCRPWTVHGTWANEQNLAAESKGKIGADQGRLITWDEWRRIADFNHEQAAEVRRLAPWIVHHYPGMAYGHGEDWGYGPNMTPMPGFPLVDGVPRVAYELCRPGIDLCPILNHHPYVHRGAPVLDEWTGVRRIEKTIALFPGKTLFVAETGDFDVWSPQAPDRIVQIAYYLQGLAPVLGWCFFILDSPDPGHAMNNWSNNRAIEDAYRRMTRIARPRTWTPEVTPVATLKGVDVSNHQGAIDWGAVAASGRTFAFMKASEDPAYVDRWFAGPQGHNWAGAKAAGLARGAYHFARPSESSPASSVALLERRIAAAGGLEAGDLVALDMEDERAPAGQNLLAWTLEWMDLAERAFGVRPVFYSGFWYMQPHGLLHPSLGAYPLWYASYQATPPPVPAGWETISFWQFTAHGRVPGISGDADENAFDGTAADLAALGKQGGIPVPDTPAQLQDRTWAACEQVQAVAAEWKAAGWPSMGAGLAALGEVGKSLVRASKQEK